MRGKQTLNKTQRTLNKTQRRHVIKLVKNGATTSDARKSLLKMLVIVYILWQLGKSNSE